MKRGDNAFIKNFEFSFQGRGAFSFSQRLFKRVTYLLNLPLTHCYWEGGGSGGGRDMGGSIEGRPRDGRSSATAQGRSHRSRTVREVGCEGHEKRWVVV